MIFNGTWFCYSSYALNSTEQARGESLISGDYCSQVLDSTAHVVKISEPREYGYLFNFFPEAVFIGVTLRSGTTYQW
ncbi:hypothetical protein AAVH_29838 [Aphelenchoides avenae]|nr:hypothetical protein AAVH_29838 [Aphelenchus avenae]